MKSNIEFFLLLGGGYLLVGCTADAQQWQTEAKWHRTLKKAIPGTLRLDENSLEFRSTKFSYRWPNTEIQTFDLSSQELRLTTYQSRHWHEPGVQRFRFTFNDPVPPDIASGLAQRVGKPTRNAVLFSDSSSIAEIPAHRRAFIGGSNGTIRFKQDGIDFISGDPSDSRSWRWADIQTLGNSNPYDFRVTGFREIVEFDLKQPLPRDVFERIWDRLYASDLNLSTTDEGVHHQ